MSSETRETVSDLSSTVGVIVVRVRVITLRRSRRTFFLKFFFFPRDLEDVTLKPGRDVAETEIKSILACTILRRSFVHRFPLFKRLYGKTTTTKSPEFEN